MSKRFVLENIDICCQGGFDLLKDISFHIPTEGIFSILGETGSGKSILAKSMIGLIPAGMKINGKIEYHQDEAVYNITKLSKRELINLRGKSFMWIPQNTGGSLNPLIRCDRQLLIPLEKKMKLTRKEAMSRIKELFEYLELYPQEKVLKSYPHELSKGMKVRFMIAMGMAMQTRTLILDEPTNGLDERRSGALLEQIKRLTKEKNMQFVIITHDLEMALVHTDSCVVLHLGKQVAAGSTEEVLKNAENSYIEALWKSLPSNGMEVVNGY